jgi:glucosamine kinase
MPRVAVGVDAGGTKTAAALSIDGEPSAVRYGAGASPTALGVERSAAVINGLIEQTLDGAMPHAIFIGVAGGSRADVARGIRDAVAARFGGAVVIVQEDASIALRAAVPQGDGAVLIAGTGSIAYAERGGAAFRCGGYGYLLGDEGSGFAIGRLAIEHLLHAYDGRVSMDRFADEIAAAVGARTAGDVLAAVYGSERPPAAIADAAAIVVQLADAGDRAAAKIVQRAAADLASLLQGVVRKAGLADSQAPIVFAGSLLANNTMLTFLLETRLLNDLPSMPIRKSAGEPYLGALAQAEKLLR